MNKPIIKKSGITDIICGKDVIIIEPSNLYGCNLGNNVFIGPFVEIQRNVVIGDNTRIQSHSFICELVKIGTDCFIAHGVMFINDPFRGGKRTFGNKNKWKETIIGNKVLIGSNSTILPVFITDNVVIGAGSVVTKDILESGIYAGNPCKFIKPVDSPEK